VLVKPFEPQHVIARVRELLQGVPSGPARTAGGVTRAVSDVPRPIERLTPHRTPPARPAAGGNGEVFGRPPQEDAGRPAQGSDLDDYFDRLDAAFANIANPGDASPARQPEMVQRREGPVMERDLDWFDSPAQPASTEQRVPSDEESLSHQRPPSHEHVIDVSPVPTPMPDPVPVTFASPAVSPAWSAPQFPPIEPPDSPSERTPEPARPIQAAPTAGVDGTSAIADAFSALLAAEQGDPDAPPVRLPMAGTFQVTDDLVDEIARRVVERLGPHAVHDLVADVVSRVTERVVREEIERIRSKHSSGL
jgi:hypothetical protein